MPTQVSQRISSIAKDPSLWKVLDLSHVDCAHFETLVDRCTMLRKLIFSRWKNEEADVIGNQGRDSIIL
jgi:hypothetical protein